MLRGDLRFSGVVISDDLGTAAQVSGYTLGQRAVDFIAAGGDIVLTVDATQARTMTQRCWRRPGTDRAFRHQVDSAALPCSRRSRPAGCSVERSARAARRSRA